ncbi:SAM-dependent DNA methyltransferase [Serratia marcescens]|uniref:N-6 DNA methylase n=1 Tax=Serratia marcescens TaxID=615 RepID=UPI00117FB4D7|nr:N-6 DNA methylase [Serratia marcescens]TSB25013.1 SAM-dependent DNA methyltransferase [Serratia marcescens]TXE37855.1 SAM-dependent DNA methyltransferase [Serratia marcescens]
MLTFTEAQNQFISLFGQTARYHHRYKVFSDFVQCGAIAIHNRFCPDDALEKQYMSLIKGYEREDVERLAHLLALVRIALAAKPCDFLGMAFMNLELGDKHRGQFFTPWSVASMMAKVQFTGLEQRLLTQPFVTISEPACGGGAMMIAAAAEIQALGYMPSQHMWVSCVDIDVVAMSMAYIQLSSLGIPGEVVLGNALADERRLVMCTPMHWLEQWPLRLQTLREFKAIS